MSVVSTATNGAPKAAGRLHVLLSSDLAEVERILTWKLASSRPHVTRLTAHLQHYRGKRLRPALLLLTARACGRMTPQHHVLAAAVEMIHTATLVHDDVLDGATLRRHVPTINAGWGNAASVLLGDMLFSQAFHLTSIVDAQACAIIGAATNRVCEGELHQVSQAGNLDLGESEYLDMIDGKTAELTSCCCRLGATYAGADPDIIERLADYGRYLGMAFQIADDLLDLTGAEETTGKTLGTDVGQRKMTLPLIHALAVLPGGDADRLRQMLTATPVALDEVRALLQRSGSLAYAQRRAGDFAESARQALDLLPLSDYRNALQDLADWSIRRES
jgi:octaprenyl-diphosphate synthase